MSQRSLLIVLLGLTAAAFTGLSTMLGGRIETAPPTGSETVPAESRAPAVAYLSSSPVDDRQPAASEDEVEVDAESVRSASPADEDAAELLVVLSDGRVPVGPATVTLYGTLDGDPVTQPVDAITGHALVTGLTTGHQHVQVSGLPPGWVLPDLDPSGASADRFVVEVDLKLGTNLCEVRLERAASVFGRVLGPEGEPLDTATVQLTSFDEKGRIDRKSVWLAVEGGSYRAFLREGVWSAQVIGLGPGGKGLGRDPRLVDLAAPQPQVRQLHAGETAQMDFVCDRFSRTIQGRILDDSDRPFGGLQLKASRIATLTESETGRTVTLLEDAGRDLSTKDGSFSFGHLGPGTYRIQVDQQFFFAVGPPGINEIGAPVEPVDVTFGADSVLRVQIAARRSHQVRVRGSIVAGRGEPLAFEGTPSMFLRSRAGGYHRDVVRSWTEGSDRRFDFYVESAVADACLEVTIGNERVLYPIALSRDVEPPPLVLRFPQ